MLSLSDTLIEYNNMSESGYDTIGGGTTGAVSGAMSGAMAGAALGPIGMGVGAIIGGLFGKKKTKVPKPPSYSQMMTGALNAQEGIQGRLIGLERQYAPEWQALNEYRMNTQLYGDGTNQGYLGMLEQLQGRMGNLEMAGARQNFALQRTLAGEARDAMLSPDQKALSQYFIQRGMRAANEGANLSPDEVRSSQQAARYAMAARGLSGRQAVAAEVLNNESYRRNRELSNMQLANTAFTLESGIQEQALKSAMSGMASVAARGQFMGASQSIGGAQKQIFEPESQMAAQAAGLKYQHGMGLAQSKMAQQQGLLNTLGSFGSMAMMGGFNFGGGGLPVTTTSGAPPASFLSPWGSPTHAPSP